jgi:Peptidase A4 family
MMKSFSSAFTAVPILAVPMAGIAQNNHKPLQANEHTLNLPGATTIDAPPAGFDPLTASDQDLAYHGFPPRPNQTTDSKVYAQWAKAMKASKTRLMPSLEQTTIFHGQSKPGKVANPTAIDSSVSTPAGSVKNLSYSTNWSGHVDFSGAASYGSSSYYFIVNDMIVPVAQHAFAGSCTPNGWDWGSEWNGIDGWGSNDVLQAGVEFDSYCVASSFATFYSAWYEWYPYGEVRISNFPVTPGDDIFVEVWHTSPTQGYAYLVNQTNNQAVEVGFTAPSGTSLVGNSAEWVVERPFVDGSFTTLTN